MTPEEITEGLVRQVHEWQDKWVGQLVFVLDSEIDEPNTSQFYVVTSVSWLDIGMGWGVVASS